MAEELEKQGHEAFIDEDYQGALDLYTRALSLEASSPNVLVSRAQAHIKLGNFKDAISDANKAIELNPSLAKAYLQKGIACFSLEEYETAKASFEKGAAVGDAGKFQTWIRKCNDKVQVKPKVNDVTMTPVQEVARAPEPAPKYRHEWYQSAAAVVVTIYAKNIKLEHAKFDFGEQTLSVMINVPNEEPYVLQTRLFGKVKTSECRYNILSTKIEIRLVKADDTHWQDLKYLKTPVAVQAPKKEAPSYPSSSRKAATKNWDKLEAEVKKEEKDEKLEGDAALNKLFREIYSNADEDTRRAMNKSFVESSGTVLSTNWKEVGGKAVEGSAPQGMEMRKWEM